MVNHHIVSKSKIESFAAMIPPLLLLCRGSRQKKEKRRNKNEFLVSASIREREKTENKETERYQSQQRRHRDGIFFKKSVIFVVVPTYFGGAAQKYIYIDGDTERESPPLSGAGTAHTVCWQQEIFIIAIILFLPR
jgi:hypothetical protein